MSNNTQLPKELTDKIFQEGQDLLAFEPDNKASYIKGATAYAPWKVKYDELRANGQWLADSLVKLHAVYSHEWSDGNKTNVRRALADWESITDEVNSPLSIALKDRLNAQDNERLMLHSKIDKYEKVLGEIITMSNAGKTLSHIDSHVAAKAREALAEGESNTPAPGEGKEASKPGVEIKVGLKFRNVHMPDYSFTVVKVLPDFLDVSITHDKEENHRWTENDWVREHTQWAFEKGEYYLPQ